MTLTFHSPEIYVLYVLVVTGEQAEDMSLGEFQRCILTDIWSNGSTFYST